MVELNRLNVNICCLKEVCTIFIDHLFCIGTCIGEENCVFANTEKYKMLL